MGRVVCLLIVLDMWFLLRFWVGCVRIVMLIWICSGFTLEAVGLVDYCGLLCSCLRCRVVGALAVFSCGLLICYGGYCLLPSFDYSLAAVCLLDLFGFGWGLLIACLCFSFVCWWLVLVGFALRLVGFECVCLFVGVYCLRCFLG